MDNFFNLLMAELSNQDPLEPMSNTEFISQMASFTALKAQQDALYYQNANYAQSLVGKTVTVPEHGAGGLKFTSGIVTSMNVTGGEFSVKVNGKDYDLASIMEISPTNNPYEISGFDGAYATSLVGKHVTVVGTSNTGARIIENGVVERIEIIDNNISIIIDDKAYPLGSVIKIEEAKTADGEKDISANDWGYATSLIGKQVTVTEPDDYGKGYEDTGIVTQVVLEKGKINLIMHGVKYPIEYVTKVEQAQD